VEQESSPLPLGRSGRLNAVPLINGNGDRALLLREVEEPRALLTSEEDDRIVLIPLDDRAELRTNRDALAAWLTAGTLTRTRGTNQPTIVAAWASAVGMVVLLAVTALAILGSFTFFGWLFRSLGVI
jgi:hypothetical protein